MLTELCQELRNWFDRKRYYGTFTIQDGQIVVPEQSWFMETPSLNEAQYFRVIGSIFNDGVHQYPDDTMTDETFDGEIWALAIPKEVVQLAEDITAWKNKYEGVDSAVMSPYISESFGGYSYSKGSNASANGASATGWKAAFASNLNRWRKI